MKIANINNTVNLLECLLWQYNKAERLKSLVQSCQDEFNGNTSQFWDNFYCNIFNIDTADTFGLTVWGNLLGVQRPIYNDNGQLRPYSDNMYRLFLKARIFFMFNNGSVSQLNKYIRFIFPELPILVLDNLDMSIDLIFYYTPSAEELTVLSNPDFLPRPSGVGINIKIINPQEVFGFEGSDLSGFDQGTFFL